MNFSEENLIRLRNETPGLENVIHFNNAGASLMPSVVAESMINYLKEELYYGGYEIAEKYASELEETYAVIANFLNCSSKEIAIVENATVAWGKGFYSIPFQKGDIILTAQAEYASNFISYLQIKEKLGVEVKVIPDDEYGQTSPEALEDMISERVKLISITHIPTNSGLVNPAKEIGAIARKHDILYLLDACQSVGQMPVNVHEIGCDMLSATGRKFLRGPRGTGFLYISEKLINKLEPIQLDLHSAVWTGENSYSPREDGKKFESWESNLAARMGLKAAVNYANSIGMEKIWERIKQLADYLRSQLLNIDGVEIHDKGFVKGGIVSFTFKNYTVKEIKQTLAQHNINVSVTFTANSLLDMKSKQLDSVVRASVHYYNTIEEIDKLCAILSKQSLSK
jgi:cysteine desulfurase / selenocysteine lyase